ncbi:P2 family phage major capsid protein [Volucribacter psittacicida]|uniref:P2 family phage major capsid protein n=1 Tax=Volucribacter psittacicida TaxID=203482 RepID=A0A4R1FY99_9PAST|nr:phage major capsid protein, P2 family [Volucribacter psittacicida]TCJ98822.1 P2 family phage major capsid protein [Volucribacter psittacicida]
MKNIKLFYELVEDIAQEYNSDSNSILRGQSFSLTVPQAAQLGENIQKKSDFLKQINMLTVSHLKGTKLLGATEKGITGRKASGRYIATLEHSEQGYELSETDSGVILPWEIFDTFATFKDRLVERYGEYVQTQIALDMLQIGWHGQSVAANTTKADLSDVNKGWLKLLAEQRAANFLTQGKETGKIKIFGAGADYVNLDDLAFDLKQGLDLRHRDRNDLVFLVGADLVGKETKLIQKQHGLTPTEKAALGSHNLMGSFGGMQAIIPPNFPAKGAVVTTLSNLSIYTQGESVRRAIYNDEDRKGIRNSYYRQEGYVVEDLGLMTAIDHSKVELGDSE